jgi:hypothetical protein
MKRLLYAACLFIVLLPWIAAMLACVIVTRRLADEDETVTFIRDTSHLAPLVREWEKDQACGVKVEGCDVKVEYSQYHAHRNPADDYIMAHVTYPKVFSEEHRTRQHRTVFLVMQNGKLVETPP